MTLQASIQLQDRMSRVLNNITQSMAVMMNTFEETRARTDAGFNAAAMDAARQGIVQASAELVRYNEELRRTATIPPPTVQQPVWNNISQPNVVVSTGAERFQAEYLAANQAAQQLMQTQQAISARARSMTVTPPGMLNDVAAVENRMQALTQRVQQLNSVPVNLRTEQVNRELEALRGHLGQASATQRELNDAMRRMDISATNAAYRQLNTIINTAEVNIRDNIVAQDQFNQRVAAGGVAYGGLIGKVKQFVGMYMGIQGVRMSVRFVSDTLSLQNVQNEAETKLGAIMQQRMRADPAAIQSIKDFASAQQAIGVVGDEVQLMGAQQLATFLNSTDALKSLIPAMNNLAVQQNGVNVSTGDMVNIGNLMGKAMQGQVGALTRVGITFDSAQEQVLKYGNEQERAAMLAQVITSNVSEMNAIMANTPQGQIQAMANAWGDIKEVVGARLYPAIMQFFNAINTNMPRAETVVMGLAGVLNVVITGFSHIINAAGAAVSFIQNNWAYIEPVVWGAVGALIAYKGAIVAYNTVQAVSNGLQAIAAARAAFKAGADIAGAAAATTATGAQVGLNMALLACPLTWIVIAIMAVVAAIAIWVRHVGGIRVAWLICVNAILTYIDIYKMAFMSSCHSIQNSIDNMLYGFAAFKAGVLNTLGNLKVMGLTILQDFINGAIDRINRLITLTNSIAGTSIEVVSHVEFAANAAVEEKGKQQQRAADLAAQRETNIQNKKDRAQADYWRKYQASQNRLQREAAIEAARNDSKQKPETTAGGGLSAAEQAAMNDVVNNTGGTAANTAAMADSMDAMDEELKYMRDAAEQEVINRFTLAELKVDVNNNNTLKTENDFNMINRMLGNVTAEILASAAEGGHI